VLITNYKNMKKERYRRKTTFEKKNTGSRPGHGSPEFGTVVAPTGLLINPNWSSHQIKRILG
jgi:hypothetical protein